MRFWSELLMREVRQCYIISTLEGKYSGVKCGEVDDVKFSHHNPPFFFTLSGCYCHMNHSFTTEVAGSFEQGSLRRGDKYYENCKTFTDNNPKREVTAMPRCPL